ncbi:MAG TPA: ankyrin repeat domain-containing protein [Vicinamibacterales bacterium]
MLQPDALKSSDPLPWSVGAGVDAWQMFRAAIAGDVAALARLLDTDPALVRSMHEYRTALYFAVRENQLDAARFLIARGAVLHHSLDRLREMTRDRGFAQMDRLLTETLSSTWNVSERGETIAAAIRERDATKTLALLDASPDAVREADEGTNQPIHWAVMTRQIGLIDDLIARGADVNAPRADGARPIQLTNGDYSYRGWRDVPEDIATKPRDVLAHLRRRGAHVDICTASHIGDLPRVRDLLDGDPSLANRPSPYVSYYACSGTPLRNAAGGGHIDIVRLLLERGADPNLAEEHIAPRGHALHAAVCNGHRAIVELLLAHGAYANVEIESSADTLSAAIRNDDAAMVELLCANGAARKVHLLAYYGDVQTAAAVFAANPALADDGAALVNAARGGQEAFVRLMLHHQPSLPARVSVGARTAELTALLFAHGMTPNVPNWLHVTALHECARHGDVDNARLFIDRGADLHARDEEYLSTPLGWAARHGQVAMTELLLARGAKTNLPDDPPWATPLAWATRRGHLPVVELLTRHRAS